MRIFLCVLLILLSSEGTVKAQSARLSRSEAKISAAALFFYIFTTDQTYVDRSKRKPSRGDEIIISASNFGDEVTSRKTISFFKNKGLDIHHLGAAKNLDLKNGHNTLDLSNPVRTSKGVIRWSVSTARDNAGSGIESSFRDSLVWMKKSNGYWKVIKWKDTGGIY